MANSNVESRTRACSTICRLVVFTSVASAGSIYAQEATDHSAHQGHEAHQQMARENRRYTRTSEMYTLPQVAMVNRNGERVNLSTLVSGDSSIALNFIFTTCTTICPVMTATFSKMRGEIEQGGGHVRMISISIDPEYDTVEKLSEYAKKFHAGPDWYFLTGGYDDVLTVQKAFNALTGEKTNHRPVTFFKAAGAREWLRIDGLANGVDLANEYRSLTPAISSNHATSH